MMGDITLKTVSFSDEKKIATFVAAKDIDIHALPPTVADRTPALEDECGPPGDELIMSVVVSNTGSADVNVKVHFMSQFVAGTS